MSNRNILHHVITVKVIGNTAALDTSRLSQAAFKNSYAHYSAIAQVLDEYDMPRTSKIVWRTQRVEDLINIALKRYGIQVQRSKTRLEWVNRNRHDMIIHLVLEERDNGQ
jgi:hypothetical protein|nr:MAG TPA: hypothetical protein [Caudoviricetes sp.]DAN63374.1 MAG TPA: hypothetical protein [Caudoviricetes sp.]DAP08770.1 MAG TPA: hypothetical protein [Caudoviricetes sp.]